MEMRLIENALVHTHDKKESPDGIHGTGSGSIDRKTACRSPGDLKTVLTLLHTYVPLHEIMISRHLDLNDQPWYHD